MQQYRLPTKDKNLPQSSQQQPPLQIYQKQWNIQTSSFTPPQLYYFMYNQNLFYYPAFDNTFIANGLQLNFPIIKHINSQGKVLKKLNLSFSAIYMLSDKIVLIWRFQNVYNSYIMTQWNLQSDKLLNVVCQDYIGKKIKNQNVRFFVFPATKLVCLVSIVKEENKNQIKIVSFQFPFRPTKQSPKSNVLYWNPQFNLKDQSTKLNNNSGIVWTEIINQNQLLVHIYDLNDPDQKVNSYTFNSDLKFNTKLYSLYLIDIWQPIPGKIYLKFQLLVSPYKIQLKYPKEKNQQKQKIISSLQSQQRYFQFIWEYKKDNFQQVNWTSQQIPQYCVQFMSGLRKINSNYKKIKNSKYLKKCKNLYQKYTYYVDQNTFSMFNTRKQQDIQKRPNLNTNSNKYYIDVNYQNRWYPQYNLQLYFDYRYMKVRNTIVIKRANIIKLFFEVKFIVTFWLMEIIQDCDEDILREVVSLTSKKQQM